MLWHGSGCHFGSFDSFACLFFFSFRRIRSGYFGSAAVLRGRDCTVSFYRIRARCRLQSKLEPDRELRGRLAELKGSLCSDMLIFCNFQKIGAKDSCIFWQFDAFSADYSGRSRKMQKNGEIRAKIGVDTADILIL